MKYKIGSMIISSLLLESCGGSGSSASSGNSLPLQNTEQTAQYLTYYRPESVHSNWFNSTWKSQKLDKITNGDAAETLSFPNASLPPSQDQTSKKGVFLGVFNGAPMSLTVDKSDSYKISINYMVLSDKNNELILKGDKSSSLKIEDFSLSGKLINNGIDFSISRGNMKEGSEISGEFKFEKFQGSILDNTFNMMGGVINDHTSSLTIPQDFTLKGYGFINRPLINKGTIELTTGKLLNVEKLDNSSGKIVLHITKDSGVALSSSGIIQISNLKITVHSDVEKGKHDIFDIPDTGSITPIFTNDAQGNIIYEGGKYVLNLIKKPTAVFFMTRNIYSPSYQNIGLFQEPDAMIFLSPHLRLSATQDNLHDGAFMDLNFIKNNASFGIYGYNSSYNHDAGIKVNTKHNFLHHTTIFHIGHDQNIKDRQSQFLAFKTSIEFPITISNIKILPAVHFAYERILTAQTSNSTALNFNKSGAFASGLSLNAKSKSGGFLSLNFNHDGISQGLFIQTGVSIKL